LISLPANLPRSPSYFSREGLFPSDDCGRSFSVGTWNEQQSTCMHPPRASVWMLTLAMTARSMEHKFQG
ncbi:hypothetical protein CLOM_g12815, partial [Closterium sp. NIES-68]